jgi:AAA15 family ATPase/GTPase
MSFPIRHENHTLEQESETFLLGRLPQDWVPNRPQHDYGADFQIGIAEGRELRGLELIVQLKASERGSDNEYFEDIRLNVSTYNYLRKLLTVVMLIKYVKTSNEAYWLFLRDIAPPKDENQKSFTVHIPKTNMLSSIYWDYIASIVRQITDLKLGAVNG